MKQIRVQIRMNALPDPEGIDSIWKHCVEGSTLDNGASNDWRSKLTLSFKCARLVQKSQNPNPRGRKC